MNKTGTTKLRKHVCLVRAWGRSARGRAFGHATTGVGLRSSS